MSRFAGTGAGRMARRIPIEIPNNAPERSVPQLGELATGIVLLTALFYVVGAFVVTVDLDRYGVVSNFDLTQTRYLVVGAWWFVQVLVWAFLTAPLAMLLRLASKALREMVDRHWRLDKISLLPSR
jgi:hypothetical protein